MASITINELITHLTSAAAQGFGDLEVLIKDHNDEPVREIQTIDVVLFIAGKKLVIFPGAAVGNYKKKEYSALILPT